MICRAWKISLLAILAISGCGKSASEAKLLEQLQLLSSRSDELKDSVENCQKVIGDLEQQIKDLSEANEATQAIIAAYGMDQSKLTIRVQELNVIDKNGKSHLRSIVDSEQKAVLFLSGRPILGERDQKAVLLADGVAVSDAKFPGKTVMLSIGNSGAALSISDQGNSSAFLVIDEAGNPALNFVGPKTNDIIILGIAKNGRQNGGILSMNSQEREASTSIIAGGVILEDSKGRNVFTTVPK